MDLNLNTFCSETYGLLQVLGVVLWIIKLGIPVIIIFFGVLDFGKAVTAAKDDEIKTSAKRLLFRILAGLVIFFVPTIVLWVFGTVQDYNDAANRDANGRSDFDYCEQAILKPWEPAPNK